MTPEQKTEAKNRVGELLVEEINDFLDRGKSPVKGGTFRKNKIDGTIGDLLDTGSMRGQIDFQPGDDDSVEVGIFDSDEAPKAFGHNSGFKGHPNERKMKKHRREFIPATNKTFTPRINQKIKRTIEEVRRGDNS